MCTLKRLGRCQPDSVLTSSSDVSSARVAESTSANRLRAVTRVCAIALRAPASVGERSHTAYDEEERIGFAAGEGTTNQENKADQRGSQARTMYRLRQA